MPARAQEAVLTRRQQKARRRVWQAWEVTAQQPEEEARLVVSTQQKVLVQ